MTRARTSIWVLVRRAIQRTPRWLRPAVCGAVVVSAIFLVRVLASVPQAFTGGEDFEDALLALVAAAGAAGLGGLGFGATRPYLKRWGRVGNWLTGIVMMWSYLGSLMLASPFVFESSAIPDDTSGWLWFAALATVLGVVAGQVFFGDGQIDRAAAERSQPQVMLLRPEDPASTAGLAASMSGWVLGATVESWIARLASTLGVALGTATIERLRAYLESPDGERGERGAEFEGELDAHQPVPFRLERDVDDLFALELVLIGPHFERTEAVLQLLAEVTVDPLASHRVQRRASA